MEFSSRKRKAEENGPVDLKVEHVQKILEGFSHKQLLEIVQEAAKEQREVRELVRFIADNNVSLRKLFVRSLSLETNSESLKAIFSQFGELVENVVIVDKNTGKSKGYGFVTFAAVEGALNALKEPSKMINGHMTVSRFALASVNPSQPHVDVNLRKIYVGNVPANMEADRLVNFFSQYGEIEEGPLGFDKQTVRSRGYAIFIFKTVEEAKRVLEEPMKTIDDGHQLSCKLANEKHTRKSSRVNSTTIANGSAICPLNETGTQVGIVPPQGFDNPSLGVNQGWNLQQQQPPHQGWSVPNSYVNHVVDGNANYNFMNQKSPPCQYAVSQVGSYGWGQSPAGNGCAYGAQPTSVASQSQSSGPAEPNSNVGDNANYNCMNQIAPPYPYAVPQVGGYGWGQSPEGNGYTFGAQPSSVASQSHPIVPAEGRPYPFSLHQFPYQNQHPQ